MPTLILCTCLFLADVPRLGSHLSLSPSLCHSGEGAASLSPLWLLPPAPSALWAPRMLQLRSVHKTAWEQILPASVPTESTAEKWAARTHLCQDQKGCAASRPHRKLMVGSHLTERAGEAEKETKLDLSGNKEGLQNKTGWWELQRRRGAPPKPVQYTARQPWRPHRLPSKPWLLLAHSGPYTEA